LADVAGPSVIGVPSRGRGCVDVRGRGVRGRSSVRFTGTGAPVDDRVDPVLFLPPSAPVAPDSLGECAMHFFLSLCFCIFLFFCAWLFFSFSLLAHGYFSHSLSISIWLFLFFFD
jgi:hypothetical protein